MIKSLFDGEEIDYFIFGENLLTVNPIIQGAQIYVLISQFDKSQ